jgi:class 3 adenylate cyclase
MSYTSLGALKITYGLRLCRLSTVISIGLILLFSHSVFSQSQPDSLWAVFNTTSNHDTIRLRALSLLCNPIYLNSNLDSAIKTANVQLGFAKNTGIAKFEADALHNKGMALLKKGQTSEALDSFNASFNLMQEFGMIAEMAKIQAEAAVALVRASAYVDAIEMFEKSLNSFTEIEDKKGIARILGNLGIVYYTKGNYPVAIDSYVKSIQLKEEIKDSDGVAITLNSLGNLNKETGDLDKALLFLNQALTVFESINHAIGIGSALSNIGEVYALKKEYAKAIEYFERSIEIKKTTNHRDGIAVSLFNIGSALFQMGELSSAYYHCEQSEQLRIDIGMKDNFESVYILKSKIKLEQADYNLALNFAEKALTMSKENGILKREMEALHLLMSANLKLNRHQQALNYLLKYNDIKDSVNHKDLQKKVLERGFEFEYSQKHYADSMAFATKETIKNLEIEKQQANINRQRIALGSSIGGFLLILLLAFSIHRGKKRSDNLLLNILPKEVAQELKKKGYADAKEFDQATVLFTDFVGFTELSTKLSASELVAEIDVCFKAFDHIITKHKLEKIKTIGDAYMAAGGLHTPKISEPADVVRAGLEMQVFIEQRKIENESIGKPAFRMRIGIHSGPVIAGIVGVKKFQYDIWGDTVNTASRMESSGKERKVNISESTYVLVKDIPGLHFESRGKIETKGKGMIEMFFVDNA